MCLNSCSNGGHWNPFFVMALRDVGGTSKWRLSTQHMGNGKVQSVDLKPSFNIVLPRGHSEIEGASCGKIISCS